MACFEGRGEQGEAFAEIFVQVRRGGGCEPYLLAWELIYTLARVFSNFSSSPVLTQFHCRPPQLLQQLYEGDVLSEEALLSWAAEKEHADESDKVYLLKVSVDEGKSLGSGA